MPAKIRISKSIGMRGPVVKLSRECANVKNSFVHLQQNNLSDLCSSLRP
jgi:hypothetical protein